MTNAITWQGATVKPILGRCELEIQAVAGAFLRGDVNDDGRVDVSDAVSILGCKFLGERCPDCRDAADANDDGLVDISDAIRLLGFLFLGSLPPPAPGPRECGTDPGEDSLPPCVSGRC